jgi:transposase
VATSQPADHGRPCSTWTLDELAATIVNEKYAEAVSRSTVWRVLEEADLKPHKSRYWLTSHDPDFDAKAREICQLYVAAPRLAEQGRLVICTDEKTGMQVLERQHPTRPPQPGRPARIEHEYIRHGTQTLIASFIVPTGQVIGDVGPTRTSRDFAAHLRHVKSALDPQRSDWVVDGLNTHWSLEVCEVVAEWCGVKFDPHRLRRGVDRKAFLTDPEHPHVFHFTPKHGSWLNQVELWFAVLGRRFLKRGEFASADEFVARLLAYLEDYNRHFQHPYRWTYLGTPLVRDTPFSRTRRQAQRGRACFSPRPKLFQRLLYPPRPYRKPAMQPAATTTS